MLRSGTAFAGLSPVSPGTLGPPRRLLGDSGNVPRRSETPDAPFGHGLSPASGRSLQDTRAAPETPRRLRGRPESPGLFFPHPHAPAGTDAELEKTQGDSGEPRRLQDTPGPKMRHGDSRRLRHARAVPGRKKDSQRLGNAPRLLGRPGGPGDSRTLRHARDVPNSVESLQDTR